MASPQLLVSVRNLAEATAALAGGADLIDIKEPNRGSLGRADSATISAVVQQVAGRVPVSAALGELRECPLVGVAADLPDELSYVKWGLSGLLGGGWVLSLQLAGMLVAKCGRSAIAGSRFSDRRTVAVAYADWVAAEAPRPADVAACVTRSDTAAVLIDTYQKDGSTLLDWLSVDEIVALVQACRKAGVCVALAGSLTGNEINRLQGVRPDWFAVRGAACERGREGTISERRVRELADLVQSL
jgi:(5-formylfuran-3-yl)methyl phosphate synthase